MSKHLSALFNPRAVAVLGASDKAGSLGQLIFSNLTASSYTGGIYAINPAHKKIMGRRCYDSIKDIDKTVDLAVICTPDATVEKILRQCARQGVKATLLLTRGPDNDKKREAWTRRLTATAKKAGIRLVGPNAMGLLRPLSGLNVLYNQNHIRSGPIALVSQSAGLCDALLDWSEAHHIGYSTVMTLGEEGDVGMGEILYYLARESRTHLLLVYLEQIRNAGALLNGLRLAAGLKPVLIFTGGSPDDRCTEAALTRSGAVLLRSIDQLFPLTRLLLEGRFPQHDNITLISNGIGPDYLATNRLEQYGLQTRVIPAESQDRLRRLSPAPVRMEQSLILAARADAKQFEKAVDLLGDAGNNSILLIITPRPQTDIDGLVETLVKLDRKHSLYLCLMGEARVHKARDALHAQGLSIYDTPAAAIDVFASAAAYQRQRSLTQDLPYAYTPDLAPGLETARTLSRQWIDRQNLRPSRSEVYELLSAMQLPMAEICSVSSLKQAISMAEAMDYPLRIKPESQSHPAPRGDIWLRDTRSLRHHYLALVAERQRHDRETGHRGIILEKAVPDQSDSIRIKIHVSRHALWQRVIEIRTPQSNPSCELMPLSPLLAENLLRRSDLIPSPALIDLLLRVSALVCEIAEIAEIELNPVRASETHLFVDDARLELQETPARAPYGHLLVHPYPPALEHDEAMSGGHTLFIRPLRPDDAGRADHFIDNVSEATLYQRFLQPLPELSVALVTQLTLLDLHNELALIAFMDTEEQPVGIARYARDGTSCDFAILIRDEWQGKGLGLRLMQRLIDAARAYGYETMEGDVLPDNSRMLGFSKRLGFDADYDAEQGLVRISLCLNRD